MSRHKNQIDFYRRRECERKMRDIARSINKIVNTVLSTRAAALFQSHYIRIVNIVLFTLVVVVVIGVLLPDGSFDFSDKDDNGGQTRDRIITKDRPKPALYREMKHSFTSRETCSKVNQLIKQFSDAVMQYGFGEKAENYLDRIMQSLQTEFTVSWPPRPADSLDLKRKFVTKMETDIRDVMHHRFMCHLIFPPPNSAWSDTSAG